MDSSQRKFGQSESGEESALPIEWVVFSAKMGFLFIIGMIGGFFFLGYQVSLQYGEFAGQIVAVGGSLFSIFIALVWFTQLAYSVDTDLGVEYRRLNLEDD